MSAFINVRIDASVYAAFVRAQRDMMAAGTETFVDALDTYHDAATALGCEIQKSMPRDYASRFLTEQPAEVVAKSAKLACLLGSQDVEAAEEEE